MRNIIYRILLLPAGLLLGLYKLAIDGSRDVSNKIRFNGSTIDGGCRIDQISRIEENCHLLQDTYVLNSRIKRFSYVGRKSMIQNTTIGSFCSIANDVL
jgi:NDP-sugar pyrophosphorylase family protein